MYFLTSPCSHFPRTLHLKAKERGHIFHLKKLLRRTICVISESTFQKRRLIRGAMLRNLTCSKKGYKVRMGTPYVGWSTHSWNRLQSWGFYKKPSLQAKPPSHASRRQSSKPSLQGKPPDANPLSQASKPSLQTPIPPPLPSSLKC